MLYFEVKFQELNTTPATKTQRLSLPPFGHATHNFRIEGAIRLAE